MRFHLSTRQIHVPAALALAILALGMLGCPKQEDFPAALDVVAPPTPSNFVITRVDPQGGFDYDFAWTISDPSEVDFYRVYLVGGGPLGADELIFETPDTTYLTTFTFSLDGLQFAVSAVSDGGIEGERRVTTVVD